MLKALKQAVAAQAKANGGIAPKVELMDTLFRDAHQCLWATRMRTEDMLPVAEMLDDVGYSVAEVIGLVQYDAAVRFLNQNPLTRLKMISERMTKTPLRSLVRSNLMAGFAPVHDDITDLFIERQVANGVTELFHYDSMHDWDVMAPGVAKSHSTGADVVIALLYNLAPGYDDEYYATIARQACEQLKPHKIQIVDAGGSLTIERVRTLIPAIKSAVFGLKTLELNTHCLTGLGPLIALEAAVHGVDTIYTAPEPMAQGNSVPGAQMIARSLSEIGYQVDVDLDKLQAIEDYLTPLARRQNKPVGVPKEFTERAYLSQMAGGALSNLESQLIDAGIHHRLPEVIEEIGRIRLELGSPIMTTPYPAIIAAQAVMNVIHGERYSMVPAEVKKYVCGYYGTPRVALDQDVVDRIMANGPKSVSETPQPHDPIVPELRKLYPRADDDELLLRYMYGDQRYDAMRPTYVKEELSANYPLSTLVSELESRGRTRAVQISGHDFSMTFNAQEAEV